MRTLHQKDTHILMAYIVMNVSKRKINSKFNKSRDGKDEKFQEVSYKL